MLWMEAWVSHSLDRCPSTEPHAQPLKWLLRTVLLDLSNHWQPSPPKVICYCIASLHLSTFLILFAKQAWIPYLLTRVLVLRQLTWFLK